MSTKNHFIFPTYVQMYPYSKDRPFLKQVREKLRYYGYKWLYQKQCSQLVDFLNTETQWQSLFTQDYYRTNTILTTFCDKRFSASERLTAITENLRLAEEKMGRSLCQQLLDEQNIVLTQLTEDLRLSLSINHIDPFEGYFSINIRNQNNERVYDASFTFLSPNKLLIASIQGPSSDNAQELVKQATKALHGMRPMFLLVNAFKMLAEKWQYELVGIPHKAQGKYRLSARSKILFNYDEFWQENQGEYRHNYWQLPLHIERKQLEDIASKKRSMYRKRYEMLDQMALDIQQL
ncbi:TPA: VirK/YbjX family protein [Haemophilus influenzae]